MALQMVFAAYILYIEVAMVLLLSVPFIPNSWWQKIFRIKFVGWLGHLGNQIFIVVAGILTLIFCDAIREIRKYEALAEEAETATAGIPMMNYHTNKFRAQRNFYISLFAFVFWIVLKRLVDVISSNATLEATKKALEKQAKGASDMAKSMMEESSKTKSKSDTKSDSKADTKSDTLALEKEIKELKIKYSEEKIKADAAINDLSVVKQQAKANEKEYDRVMKELEKYQNGEGDKKDD